jgi:hypothetical protein
MSNAIARLKHAGKGDPGQQHQLALVVRPAPKLQKQLVADATDLFRAKECLELNLATRMRTGRRKSAARFWHHEMLLVLLRLALGSARSSCDPQRPRWDRVACSTEHGA